MKNSLKLLLIVFVILFSLQVIPVNSTVDNVSFSLKESNAKQFQPYKFIAYGDTRHDTRGDDNSGIVITANIINDLMNENDIEFIIHTGDLVNTGGEQEEYDQYYWPTMTSINNSVPIYYAVGNHEYNKYQGYDIDLETFRFNVQNPGNEVYYSFNTPQNDTHVIVLNTDYYFNDNNVTRQNEQLAWLEEDFSKNSIGRIIVSIHRPFWGANPSRVLDEYEPLREIFHDLFIENGVDLVFSGHDHMFYHTIRNGTHYTITGGGTAALYTPFPEHPYVNKTWLDDDLAFSDNHVCLVEVQETYMNVKAIVANKSVIYEYNVSAHAPDIYPPILSSPEDITMTKGTAGNIVSWIAKDAHAMNFSLFQDDTFVHSGNSSSGIPIEYSLDSLPEGIFNFKLVVSDFYGLSTEDSVMVTVQEAIITSDSTTTTIGSITSIETTTTIESTTFPNILFIVLPMLFLLHRRKRK